MGVPRRAPRLEFDLAREADDAGVRRLLRRSPMEGEIRVTLEREPSVFLASAIEGDVHQVVVARDADSGAILGLGSRSVMEAYVNGRRTRLGYLSQLRIDRSYQGRGFRILAGGFAKIRELHERRDATLYATTIVSDNRPARRILERGLRGLPTYRRIGTLSTLTIPVRSVRRFPAPPWLTIERGSRERLPAIASCLQRNAPRFQFARHWTEEELASSERTRGLRPEDFVLAVEGGRVVGCLARWDQRGFKQVVIRGYGRRLGRARPLLNLLSRPLRMPKLPPPGSQLALAYVSHLAIDADDPRILLALLSRVARESRGSFELLSVGLPRRSHLTDVVKAAFFHHEYSSEVYVVYFEDGAEEAARLDDRLPHLEVAIL